MARNSWYHVCEVLATYDFPDVLRPKPFTQKTVREFLEDAGYRKALATEDVAATDHPPATRSKASSSVSSGVSSLTAGTPAALAVPCRRKIERARLQADFARRWTYSQLDEHARGTIASSDWCWLFFCRVCRQICDAFVTYQTTREFARVPLDPKAVVAEVRLTVEYFSMMDLWPWWVLQPNDPALRSTPADAAAYEDFGNDIWEALVNVMNLSSAIPSVYGQEILNAPASAMYGDRAKKSGVGHYSFRGNVVERLLTYLLHASEQERLQCIHRLPQSAAGGN